MWKSASWQLVLDLSLYGEIKWCQAGSKAAVLRAVHCYRSRACQSLTKLRRWECHADQALKAWPRGYVSHLKDWIRGLCLMVGMKEQAWQYFPWKSDLPEDSNLSAAHWAVLHICVLSSAPDKTFLLSTEFSPDSSSLPTVFALFLIKKRKQEKLFLFNEISCLKTENLKLSHWSFLFCFIT